MSSETFFVIVNAELVLVSVFAILCMKTSKSKENKKTFNKSINSCFNNRYQKSLEKYQDGNH